MFLSLISLHNNLKISGIYSSTRSSFSLLGLVGGAAWGFPELHGCPQAAPRSHGSPSSWPTPQLQGPGHMSEGCLSRPQLRIVNRCFYSCSFGQHESHSCTGHQKVREVRSSAALSSAGSHGRGCRWGELGTGPISCLNAAASAPPTETRSTPPPRVSRASPRPQLLPYP